MLFNSISYAIFLPIVFCLYWIIPLKMRWVLLLVSSYYFYMSWSAKYVVLIVFTTVVSYVAGLMLERSNSKRNKKIVLLGSLVFLLGLLCVFKYFDFFSTSLCTFFSRFALEIQPITLKLMLPVGISFYTFQTISYIVDVYKGRIRAEKNLGVYATFISFFPQLVAGPIERTNDLLPQIKQSSQFNYECATYGLKLMAWGFYKKIVVADNLAPIVDKIYSNPSNFRGFALIIATVLFAFQIYCDFSGYSDIAIGTSKLFGINLTKNFDSPYFSTSIKEFWSRWHISLSRWFRDYVYIPLGGNRCSKFRNSTNLLITFTISGLWHGANLTFIVWGGVHGILQVIEKNLFQSNKVYGKIHVIFRGICVFGLCCFAWIFFRAENLSQAMFVIGHMFEGALDIVNYLRDGWIALGLSSYEALFIFIIIVILLVYDYASMRVNVIEKISLKPICVRWSIYVVVVLFILFFRAISQNQAFIYFQF